MILGMLGFINVVLRVCVKHYSLNIYWSHDMRLETKEKKCLVGEWWVNGFSQRYVELQAH